MNWLKQQLAVSSWLAFARDRPTDSSQERCQHGVSGGPHTVEIRLLGGAPTALSEPRTSTSSACAVST
jgi:hypothetical protein